MISLFLLEIISQKELRGKIIPFYEEYKLRPKNKETSRIIISVTLFVKAWNKKTMEQKGTTKQKEEKLIQGEE